MCASKDSRVQTKSCDRLASRTYLAAREDYLHESQTKVLQLLYVGSQTCACFKCEPEKFLEIKKLQNIIDKSSIHKHLENGILKMVNYYTSCKKVVLSTNII